MNGTRKPGFAARGGALVLLAVPALALGLLGPRAWASLATGLPPAERTRAGEAVTLVDDWADTYDPTSEQVQQLNNYITDQATSQRQQVLGETIKFIRQVINKYQGVRRSNYERTLYYKTLEANLTFRIFIINAQLSLYRDGFVPTSPFTVRTFVGAPESRRHVRS